MKSIIITMFLILLAFVKINTTNAAEIQNTPPDICPNIEVISPCSCSIDKTHGVVMDCSNVSTEQELQTIFAKPFPQNDLYEFIMHQRNIDSTIRDLPFGVFGSKTFESVALSYINFNFSFNTFDHMNATLQRFSVSSAPIYKVNYNFNAYTVLIDFELLYCPLTDFIISSPTLKGLHLIRTNITERADNKPYLFGIMPNLMYLYISFGDLHKVPDTSRYPKLEEFVINDNHISSIDGSLLTENYMYVFRVEGNDLQDIPVDSIKMSEDSSFIMSHNQVKHLDEEKWRKIFLNVSVIKLTGNPLDCSCGITWIFGNDNSGTPFMQKMTGNEKCNDDVLFTDLDRSTYAMC